MTEIIGVQLSKSGGLVIKNSCHAKAVKKVMGKGINFLEGGPGKVVDLTENSNRGFEIVNAHRKRKNRVQSIIKWEEFRKSILVYN